MEEKEKFGPDDIFFMRITDKNSIKKVLLDFNDRLPPLQGEEGYVDSVSDKIAKNGIALCMLLKNTIIGFFTMYANDHENRKAFISFIAVDSSYRAAGYGTMLLKKAVQTAKENNMELMKLEVLKDNVIAQNFYKKHGFYTIGESENSIYLAKKL
ncbi:GNAT family N-acetyltransferase [Ruminococcus flavefaciens]|uniref:GNAT family N-acetyltransferase n=1 Tax=Ruminococcus flavefaciens TaxID=1265 RepID=UPI0026ECA0A5|nr:GNAT family N-acetyltransferase [Ruminococcus flavefaciens]